MESTDLQALTERVQAGDPAAAAEFVRRFEPQIRRAIRIRGTGRPLQRVLDSEDVCQSVLRRFLGELKDRGLPADEPVGLLKWLVTVARNRQREVLRREGGDKHGGGRRREVGPEALAEVADPAVVGVELEQRDLLEQVLARLTEEERRIARWRADGVPWEEIARELGKGAEALRKSYQRAVSRVVEGLEEP